MHLELKIFFKFVRKIVYYFATLTNPIFHLGDLRRFHHNLKFVELYDEDANKYVYECLMKGEPTLIAKFGSVELEALVQYRLTKVKQYSLEDYWEFISSQLPSLGWLENIDHLCKNAGFFPNDISLLEKFAEIYHNAILEIDILGSCLKQERFFNNELANCVRINLDGYLEPFFYSEPWTMALFGKKVLVIYPFADDIKNQYKRRIKIWGNKKILPDFDLITYEPVQSMLGIETPYKTWFDALNKMISDIDEIDFDIAIVGCGAYGLPVSAFIKGKGKVAIHMGGSVQLLFGIIGKRWEDLENYKKYMNEFWIHPSQQYVPSNAADVENGCYW